MTSTHAPPRRKIRTLAEGLQFGEGPRWREGRLWFSDLNARAVKSVSLVADLRTEFMIDDQPSGLGWAADGAMLIVSMKQQRVLRRSPEGRISLHADLSGLANFDCNDMVVDADGGAYVGSLGFDLDAEIAAHGFRAVLADHPTAPLVWISPEGQARVAAEGLHIPNGSVITPDGRTLIVAETFGKRLTAFEIGAEGALSNRRTWADLGDRLPDGICMDALGQIWVANPGGRECALVAQGGEIIETIATEDTCYACMLGGEDGRSLFLLTARERTATSIATSGGKVLVVGVDTPGAGGPETP